MNLRSLVGLASALLLLEIPVTSSLLRLGRRLEIHLRLAFLEKLPRLSDRYFQSRPKSDMAERSHSIHLPRTSQSARRQEPRRRWKWNAHLLDENRQEQNERPMSRQEVERFSHEFTG